ncbi:MAG: pilus assembly protein [Kineosporiaceae bacterium]|nr:pilus assembly protein [Kineosporiaceae bacterium]MBK7623485.1 pilus assembly protein [Kineosporiaceae bacterium]MBK8073971.1 pilus assembly protein [Kineosporiaceae bacterium]
MVLFPALLALIFIVVQAGLHYYARSVALSAAREGVRAAAVQDGTAADGQAAADAFLARVADDLLAGSQVSADRTAQTVTVTVTGTSLSLVPGYPGFAISQQASAPVERVS